MCGGVCVCVRVIVTWVGLENTEILKLFSEPSNSLSEGFNCIFVLFFFEEKMDRKKKHGCPKGIKRSNEGTAQLSL